MAKSAEETAKKLTPPLEGNANEGSGPEYGGGTGEHGKGDGRIRSGERKQLAEVDGRKGEHEAGQGEERMAQTTSQQLRSQSRIFEFLNLRRPPAQPSTTTKPKVTADALRQAASLSSVKPATLNSLSIDNGSLSHHFTPLGQRQASSHCGPDQPRIKT